MRPGNFQQLADFSQSVTELLRGAFRPSHYKHVMLPLTIQRCFNGVIVPTKESVLQKCDSLKEYILCCTLREIDPCTNDAWNVWTNLVQVEKHTMASLREVTE